MDLAAHLVRPWRRVKIAEHDRFVTGGWPGRGNGPEGCAPVGGVSSVTVLPSPKLLWATIIVRRAILVWPCRTCARAGCRDVHAAGVALHRQRIGSSRCSLACATPFGRAQSEMVPASGLIV